MFPDADLTTNPPPEPSQHTVRAVTHHPTLLHLLAVLYSISMPSRAECRCLCRFMSHEEADHRLAAGWHVDLEEADALCSAQRKRYLRLEWEQLHPSVVIPTDKPLVEHPT